MTDRMCQKWFVKLCTGDFSLDDAPRWGSPAEVDSDQIKTLIENNRHYTKSIKFLVKMKTVSFILRKKPNGLFGQLNHMPYGENKEGNVEGSTGVSEL